MIYGLFGGQRFFHLVPVRFGRGERMITVAHRKQKIGYSSVIFKLHFFGYEVIKFFNNAFRIAHAPTP